MNYLLKKTLSEKLQINGVLSFHLIPTYFTYFQLISEVALGRITECFIIFMHDALC